MDLYEPTTLGFVTFDPINSAEGKRLIEVRLLRACLIVVNLFP